MNSGATSSSSSSSRRLPRRNQAKSGEEALANSRLCRTASFADPSQTDPQSDHRFTVSPFHRFNAILTALVLVFFAFASLAQTISPANLPLYFEANNSQTEFLSSGNGCQFTISASGVGMALRESKARAVTAQMRFVGANSAAQIAGGGEMPGKVNYLIGNDSSKWLTGLPTFANVQVTQLYPGINMVFHGNQRQLEYDFTIAPGANPDAVKMRFDGVDNISVSRQGDLILKIGTHEIRQPKPEVYQTVSGECRTIAGGYKILDSRTVAFEISEYDHTLPLVIDPVLGYSAFFGGNVGDTAWAIAVDTNNFIYLAGETFSTKFSTVGAVQTNFAGGNFNGDAFIAKLDQTGTNLIYLTYLGGSADDVATGLAVDTNGYAFICGGTQSADFPTTTNAVFPTIQTAYNPTYRFQPMCGFVAELNTNGTQLKYSTYLGGKSSQNLVQGIAVDSADNAYAVGCTYAINFPVTTNAFQPHFGGTNDTTFFNANGFLTEIASNGSSLVYSTYLGGTNLDSATGVAVDSSNYVYVCGYTASFNFPTWNTPTNLPGGNHLNGINQTNTSVPAANFGYDAFVTKFPPLNGTISPASQTNAIGSYSTFLGGTNDDVAYGIAFDAQGNAYVTGWTASTNFPVFNAPPGLTSFLTTNGNSGPVATNVFLTKISADGSNVLNSVVFGGNLVDIGHGVAVDANGDAFVVGAETSYTNFPTVNAFGSLLATNSSTIVGTRDAFVTGISADWSSVLYSVCLGGTYDTFGYGIALDSSTNVYITGTTLSANFPTFDAGRFSFNGITNVINGTNFIDGNNFTGTNDAFLTKILFGTTTPTVSTVQPAQQTVGNGATVTFSVTVTGATGQLLYQWQTNGVNIVNGGRISGATSSTLTISNAVPSDSSINTNPLTIDTNYSVIVSYPGNPGASITNTDLNGGALTVLDVPYIEATSPATNIVPVGTNVSFSVTVSGSPLFYLWGAFGYFLTNTPGISGGTSNTLTISDVQTNDAGTYIMNVYQVHQGNNYFNATNTRFTLIVVEPLTIVTAPTNQTVGAGSTVSFTVEASGFPLNYQWSTDDGVTFLTNGDNISGATSSTLTITNVQSADTGTYTVFINNGLEYPDFTVSTNLSAVLTLTPGPSITSIDPPPGSTNPMIISGTGGGSGQTYYVLTSTNLTTWKRIATNQFDSQGRFSFTNSPPTNAAQFFRLEQP